MKMLSLLVLPFALTVAACSSSHPSTAPAAAPAAPATVIYTLTGTASLMDVTYMNADGTEGQQTHRHLGPAYVGDVQAGDFHMTLQMSPGPNYAISAQNTTTEEAATSMGDYGNITCSVQVNGVEVTTHTSTGEAAIVECGGTV